MRSAACRVVHSAELQADESPLTGEFLPVDKSAHHNAPETPLPDRTAMLHAGTAVFAGRAEAVVTATGMATQLGRIAALLESAQSGQTPPQRRLAKLSKQLAVAVVVICVVVFVAGILRGNADLYMMLPIAISLAVAAVPEGLPAVITIALALGSQRMSHRKAIVRQLAAVETFGSVSVICSDKTGTLTQNKMVVADDVKRRLADTIERHARSGHRMLGFAPPAPPCMRVSRPSTSCGSSKRCNPAARSWP